MNNARIAVLLPCYNEAITIKKVIDDFQKELPQAKIYVYDNNSTDGSDAIAESAGVIVRRVTQQGKGHVVRRMFQEIEADCYVMVDSDDTYPADEVEKLIRPIVEGKADMVVGDRLSSTYMTENKRPFHNVGNTLVVSLIRYLFRSKVVDVMSGYRAFNRLFIKNCPVISAGFEIETEMTLHALNKRMNIIEVPIEYRDRPKGSSSKLNTFADGFRVLKTIFNLLRYYRPMMFFSCVAGVLAIVSIGMFIPVFIEYVKTGLVPRFPTMIVSGFMAIASLVSLTCGMILDSVMRYHNQVAEVLMNTNNKAKL